MAHITRRDFLKLAGLLAAGGVGYRLAHNQLGRDFANERSADWLAQVSPADQAETLPNFILICTDDLGYGDLGSYGSLAIRTPNLDEMAGQGTHMTNFYACAPLCSPSRAGLLTGRYPIRTHITMPLYPSGAPLDIAFRIGVYNYGVRGIPEDEILLSEALQRRGYRTALLGKWHLGDRSPHLPNDNGFDLFYGALFSNDMPPYEIYRNRQVEIPAPAEQGALTAQLTREAVAFIHQNAGSPFFLYYAQPFPHDPQYPADEFRGRSAAGWYGDKVEEIDWSVGEILRTLKELHLDEKTLVIFTSDNGPWWEGSPAGLRGRKNLPFEGGLRVPLIARWPGVIPAGRVVESQAINMDFFPTMLNLAGVPLPTDRIIDGLDMLPLLSGANSSHHTRLFYYKHSSLLGVRDHNWKYLRRHMTDNGGYASLRQGPFLYNLDTDPDESYNLIQAQPEIAAQMEAILDEWDQQVHDNPRGWR